VSSADFNLARSALPAVRRHAARCRRSSHGHGTRPILKAGSPQRRKKWRTEGRDDDENEKEEEEEKEKRTSNCSATSFRKAQILRRFPIFLVIKCWSFTKGYIVDGRFFKSSVHRVGIIDIIHGVRENFGRDGCHTERGIFAHRRQRVLRREDCLHHRRHRLHGQSAPGEVAQVVSGSLQDLPPDQAEEGTRCTRTIETAPVFTGELHFFSFSTQIFFWRIFFLSLQLFDPIRKSRPTDLHKVLPIEGDITQPELAISPNDRLTLARTVNIVFHSAATIKFDEKLKLSVTINMLGTQRLVELCKRMTNLEALVSRWSHKILLFSFVVGLSEILNVFGAKMVIKLEPVCFVVTSYVRSFYLGW
jgi:hypothetical protein